MNDGVWLEASRSFGGLQRPHPPDQFIEEFLSYLFESVGGPIYGLVFALNAHVGQDVLLQPGHCFTTPPRPFSRQWQWKLPSFSSVF